MKHEPVVFLVVVVVEARCKRDERQRERDTRLARRRKRRRVTFHTRTRFPISGISHNSVGSVCHERSIRCTRAAETLGAVCPRAQTLVHGNARSLPWRARVSIADRGVSLPRVVHRLRQVMHWEAYPAPQPFSVAARNRAGWSAATHTRSFAYPSVLFVRSFVGPSARPHATALRREVTRRRAPRRRETRREHPKPEAAQTRAR